MKINCKKCNAHIGDVDGSGVAVQVNPAALQREAFSDDDVDEGAADKRWWMDVPFRVEADVTAWCNRHGPRGVQGRKLRAELSAGTQTIRI